MQNSVKAFFLLSCVFALSIGAVSAQEEVEPEPQKKKKKEKSLDEQLASRAALKSAILPGWGQFQNGGKHRLKVPIIYGALGTLGYFTYNSHQLFKCYETGYILDSRGEEGECQNLTSNAQLKDGMETYHKQRDMFVLITIGAYALNVLDAYVWGHLQHFDNSDDLSLRIYPSFINIADRQYAAFTVQLKL